MIQLRPYQDELIVGVRQHFRQARKRVLIQLGTGGGKTAICSRMLHNASERGKVVWFLCHRRELVKQVSKALTLEGVEHGFVTSKDRMNLAASAQICSIPTLINRLDRLPPPDLIAWDECHHQAAGSWASIARMFPDAYHIGLSATPKRLDGAGLGDYYDSMVCGPSIAWMIENKYLSPFKLFAPTLVDTSKLHKRMGDFVKSETSELMGKPKIIGDAFVQWKKHCDGAKTLVFCASVKNSQLTAEKFNANGVPAIHLDGNTDDFLRDQIMDDFDAGKIRVITNVDLFSEGYDCRSLEAVSLMRPTMSLTIYLQQVGRALRMFEGKGDAILLDHVGNSELHGLPDDDREWQLTSGKPDRVKASVPPPRICGMCFAANRAGATVCRVCATAFPVEGRQVDQVDGELSEIDAARERQQQRHVQALTKDIESLTQLGRMRGMKNPAGWARHVFEAREKKRAGGR